MLRVQRGDRRALDQLFERYNGRLFNFIYRILGDMESAEDIVQETWLSLYERRDSYQSTYKFSTWLFTIGRRKALSELRRRGVRSMVRSLTAFDGNREVESLEPPQKTFNSPEASADSALLSIMVENALRTLPPHQREVVVLRDIEGFDNEEISEVLGWNLKPGAVRKRVFDAREAFRRAMLALGYREEE
jgi:RNA polymerase sigma-70 factor (ECF subfamily)